MALQLNYNGQENCYLKAVPTTLSEIYVDEIKTFTTYVIYSISTEMGGEIIFRDGFEIEFNPEQSIFTQIYTYLKEIYNTSSDI